VLTGTLPLLIAALTAPSHANEGSRFGFNHPWLTPIAPPITTCTLNSYPTLAATGAGWVRPHYAGPAIWGEIESSSGYDWSEMDAVITAAHGNGFSVLATVFPYYDSDQSSCNSTLAAMSVSYDTGFFPELGDYRQAPCSPSSYEAFLGDMIERYDDDGTDDMSYLGEPVAYWEVSNEPALAMGGSQIFYYGDPASYAPLVESTWNQVSANSMSVLNGGMYAYSGTATGYWGYVLADAEPYIDVFSYHMVGGTASDPDSMVDDVVSWLTSTLTSGTPYDVWVTELEFNAAEFGHPTTPLSQTDAINHLLETYLRTFAAGAEKIFMAGPNYDQSYATCSGVGPVAGNPFALIDTSGTTTAVYTAFSTMVGQIDEFTAVSEPSTDIFEFTMSSSTVYAVLPGADASTFLTGLGYAASDKVWVTFPNGNTHHMRVDTLSTNTNTRFIQ
jgi:hypothetical protein